MGCQYGYRPASMPIYISACERLFDYSAWMRQFPTGLSCQVHGIWSFCHNPTCWIILLPKGWLARLVRLWRNLSWHTLFLPVLPPLLVGAESSYGRCRICFLPDMQAALTKALCNNSSLFSSLVNLNKFYNWCSQKRKSAVYAVSSLRHIILLVVCDVVKYVLQPVQLLAV